MHGRKYAARDATSSEVVVKQTNFDPVAGAFLELPEKSAPGLICPQDVGLEMDLPSRSVDRGEHRFDSTRSVGMDLDLISASEYHPTSLPSGWV
jgi:hypothetical protein